MDKKLYRYVKNQYKNKVDLMIVRQNLLNNGWPQEEVDEAISKVTTPSNKKKYVFLISVILVIGLSFSLMSMLNEASEPINTERDSNNEINSEDNQEELEEISQDESEQDINCEDVFDKDACYLEKIEKGSFDCEPLEDPVERTACYRAYESFLLGDD